MEIAMETSREREFEGWGGEVLLSLHAPSVHVTVRATNVGTIGGTADCGKRFNKNTQQMKRSFNFRFLLQKKSKNLLYTTFFHWNNWEYTSRTLCQIDQQYIAPLFQLSVYLCTYLYTYVCIYIYIYGSSCIRTTRTGREKKIVKSSNLWALVDEQKLK
jgi:hypothetical protein